MSILSDHIARDNKGRAITRIADHGDVKVGDYFVACFGIARINSIATRPDGWITYDLEGQPSYSVHPSNCVELAVLSGATTEPTVKPVPPIPGFRLGYPEVTPGLSFGADAPAPLKLSEKYRPRTLCDVFGQGSALCQLQAYLDAPYPVAFLFDGATGTGKTSTALALAAEMGVDPNWSLIHIKSGEQDGDSVTGALKTLRFSAVNGGWKMIIVDEADYMSVKAGNMWLSALEDLPPRSVIVFTTNHPEKFQDRFLDRCERITFNADAMTLSLDAESLLRHVWRSETGRDDHPALESLPNVVDKHGNVSFRRLLSAIESALRTRPRDETPAPSPEPVANPEPIAPAIEVAPEPVKATRSARCIILEAVEAYRREGDRGHGNYAVARVNVIYGETTKAQRSAITRKLNQAGFGDDYHDATGRFLGFVGHCVRGSAVTFPAPGPTDPPSAPEDATEGKPEASVEAPTIDVALSELVNDAHQLRKRTPFGFFACDVIPPRVDELAAYFAREDAAVLPKTPYEPIGWRNSYTYCKILQEQVKGLSFFTALMAVEKHFPMLFAPADPEPESPLADITADEVVGTIETPIGWAEIEPDTPDYAYGNDSPTPDYVTPVDSALAGRARLARVEPDDDEPARVPTCSVDVDDPWLDRVSGYLAGFVMDSVRRLREVPAREDSPYWPYWSMGQQSRENLVHFLDRIGFRTSEPDGYARFIMLCHACVNGSMVTFPIPTDPAPGGDDDGRSESPCREPDHRVASGDQGMPGAGPGGHAVGQKRAGGGLGGDRPGARGRQADQGDPFRPGLGSDSLLTPSYAVIHETPFMDMLAEHGLRPVCGGSEEAEFIMEALDLETPKDLDPTDPLSGPFKMVAKAKAYGFLRLSADTPGQLRRCDVFRVMDSARSWLTTEELRGFARWLRSAVSDEVKDEVNEVFVELVPAIMPR